MALLFGFIFIVFGALNLFPSFIRMRTKIGNVLQGDKTEISKGTIHTGQIVGSIAIIIGFFLIFLSVDESDTNSLKKDPFHWEPSKTYIQR